MNKLAETNEVIDTFTRLTSAGMKPDNNFILLDIAKSLAIIADSLSEKEEKEEA